MNINFPRNLAQIESDSESNLRHLPCVRDIHPGSCKNLFRGVDEANSDVSSIPFRRSFHGLQTKKAKQVAVAKTFSYEGRFGLPTQHVLGFPRNLRPRNQRSQVKIIQDLSNNSTKNRTEKKLCEL
uniref:Uncharacterized protein n=1 Tax=Rhizophora mucronata TaxID=61149 RepID=A0A2P2J8P0_RHIMU